MIILGTNSIKETGYDVANSVRMNRGDSPSFTRSVSSNGDFNNNTLSMWVKKCSNGIDTNRLWLEFENGTNYEEVRFKDDDTLRIYSESGGGTYFEIITNRKFRDTSAFYHICVIYDYSQATNTNRIKLFINGVQETSFSTFSVPNQGANSSMNKSGNTVYVGAYPTGSNYFDGYLAEMVWLDGTSASVTDFGEFDEDSGIFKPIDVSGLTAGTNGWYMDYESSGSLGNDVFGSNNFTVNNLTAIDQSTDTCTNNFCTLNPLNMSNSGYVFSEGNLKGTVSGAWLGGTSTFFVNKGKWYWEVKYGSGNFGLGIGQAETNATDIRLVSTNNHGYVSYHVGGFEFFQNGSDTFNRTNNGNIGSYGSQATSGQIVMIAYDADNGKLFAGRQGTFFNSSNPANGTSPMFTVTSSAYFTPSLSIEGGVHEMNFGSPPYSESGGETDADGYGNFAHAPPSGFFSLCTKNLAEYG